MVVINCYFRLTRTKGTLYLLILGFWSTFIIFILVIDLFFVSVLSGFPPKQLLLENKDEALSSVDIRSGDTLIIEDDKKAPRVSLDSYRKSLSSAALGKITRK